MIFTRKIYLDKLIKSRKNGLIKVVTGLRRSGKSFLLSNIFKNYLLDSGIDNEHIIQINFDEERNVNLLNKEKLLKYIYSKIIDKKEYILILDEIQNVPHFEPTVIQLMREENVDVYITGSNSKFISLGMDTNLRGKVDIIHIFPLSYKEITNVLGSNDQIWNDYKMFGGLPFIYSQLTSYEERANYLKNLFKETYIADILDRYRIKHPQEIDEIIDVLASTIGNLVSAKRIADTILSIKKTKMKTSTIYSYINHFIDSYLLHELKRCDVKGNKHIGATRKYYFEDIGLRNARLNFNNLNEGSILENVVFNELIRRGFTVDVLVVKNRKVVGSKQANVWNEIDFQATKSFNKMYIQVTKHLDDSNNENGNYQREVKVLSSIKDSVKKILITEDSIPPSFTKDGILIINIKDFLLDKSFDG